MNPIQAIFEHRVAEKTLELIRAANLDATNMILYAPKVYGDFRDKARDLIYAEVRR